MRDATGTDRHLHLTETARIPWDGLILGWGPMLPFPAALLAVLAGGAEAAALGREGIVLWGAAITFFVAGVRRGLSFRSPGGVRSGQVAVFAALFAVGIAALLLPAGAALWLLAASFASLAVLDPRAARAGEAPLYFARLRPAQMALPALCLAGVALAG